MHRCKYWGVQNSGQIKELVFFLCASDSIWLCHVGHQGAVCFSLDLYLLDLFFFSVFFSFFFCLGAIICWSNIISA